MDNLKKWIITNLARYVAMSTGNVNSYRRIRRFFSRERASDKVNCHGFTFYVLGIDKSPYPREIPAEVMEDFAYRSCFEADMVNGTIITFIEGRSDIAHSSVYIPTSQGPVLIQKIEAGDNYCISTLEKFLKEDPALKNETRIEYYKFMPQYSSIPDFFTRNT